MLTFTMRLDGEDEKQFKDLAALLRLSRVETIRYCIRAVWTDLNKDHPEAKAALEKLQSLADLMKSLNDEQ